MAAKDKYYFLLTATQDGPAVSRPNPLPRQLDLNQPVELELTIADDLQKWGEADRVHEVLLRFRIHGNVETDRIQFALNGQILPDDLRRKINSLYKMDGPRYRVMGGVLAHFQIGRGPLAGAGQKPHRSDAVGARRGFGRSLLYADRC